MKLQRLIWIYDNRLEHFIVPKRNFAEIIRVHDGTELAPVAAEKIYVFQYAERLIVISLNIDPGARIASFMHAVINQPDMPAHGGAPARRIKVGLGRNCILIVTEMVSDIRQQFDQRDAQIRNVALLPIGHDQGKSVENKLAKAGVVFGQITDLRFRELLRRTCVLRSAIEIAWTTGFE